MRNAMILMVALAVLAGCRRTEEAATESSATATTAAKEIAATPVAPAEPVSGADVGQLMPAYEAKYLDGSAFRLADQRGKVVMLNIWATWCGPCRFEIPELQALHDKYAARGFAVIGASVDEGDPKIVEDFATEQKIRYPLVHDPDGKVAGLLDASVLPTTVVIDKSGRIVWKKIGVVTPNDQELTTAIEKAL